MTPINSVYLLLPKCMLVGNDAATSINLALRSAIFRAQERRFHAVLFACHAIKGSAEAVAADTVAIGTIVGAGDEFPIRAVIPVNIKIAYTKLGGGAGCITRESDFYISTAKRFLFKYYIS